MTNGSGAIGIFDSGLGGLTVARAIRRAFPNEAIHYLGDTARVPYGTKSADTVCNYARENIAYLLRHDVKIIIAACNTVSAVAMPQVCENLPVPVLGVVEMGARAAVLARPENEPATQKKTAQSAQNTVQNAQDAMLDTPEKVQSSSEKTGQNQQSDANHNPRKIGIIATHTTINSGAYAQAIHRLDPRIEVMQQACPLLVPLIEEGWLEHSVTDAVIDEYLSEMRQARIDTLILGCTHYPLIGNALARYFGQKVRQIDSAQAMAHALQQTFDNETVAVASENQSQNSRYVVTDRYHHFHKLVTAFMGDESLRIEQLASDKL